MRTQGRVSGRNSLNESDVMVGKILAIKNYQQHIIRATILSRRSSKHQSRNSHLDSGYASQRGYGRGQNRPHQTPALVSLSVDIRRQGISSSI